MPDQGVPLPVPVPEPSRLYKRRASDKLSRRILKWGGFALVAAGSAFSVVWGLTKQSLVTRPEWNEFQKVDAKFHGSIDEKLSNVDKSQTSQAASLSEINKVLTKIEIKLERADRHR